VADADVENSVPIITETKLTVAPLGPGYFNKESEMYENQNSIDFGGKGINANSAYAIESKLGGCQKHKCKYPSYIFPLIFHIHSLIAVYRLQAIYLRHFYLSHGQF